MTQEEKSRYEHGLSVESTNKSNQSQSHMTPQHKRSVIGQLMRGV